MKKICAIAYNELYMYEVFAKVIDFFDYYFVEHLTSEQSI